MYCPECGKQINDETVCPHCGANVLSDSAPKAEPKTEKAACCEGKQTVQPADSPKKKNALKIILPLVSLVVIAAILVGILLPMLSKKEEEKKPSASKEPEEVAETSSFAVERISAQERDILTNSSVSVLVTVEMREGSEYSELSIATADKSILGAVNDNGEDGDAQAGDDVYSGMIPFYSEEAVSMKIYVLYDNELSGKYETVYFYPEYKPEYYDEYAELDSELDDISGRFTDLEDAHNAIIEALDEKKENGEIIDYVFESSCITVKLLSGATYVYTYNPGGEYKSSGDDSEETPDQDEEVWMYTISPNVNTVLTLQPYRHELGEGGVDTAARSVGNSSYEFVFNSNSDNSDVNVELMKNLAQYNVILLDGHGGYSRSLHSFFGIGTVVTEDRDSLYWADLYHSRIIRLSGGQYGVTAAFFDRYYEKDDFGNTIMYLGCCHGADDSVLADTLISKGVDAIYAYKNSVSVSYDKNMVTTLFAELTKDQSDPVTVSEALDTAQSKLGKTDDSKAHWYNWLFGNYEKESQRARLYLFGDDDFTLSMESSSLRGKVADSATGDPIYHAAVVAYKAGTNQSVYTAKTDTSGVFILPLESGSYDIVVRSGGYMYCNVNNIRIYRNSTTYLQNTILLKQREGDPISVISGTVTNAVTGASVDGASISFRQNYNQQTGDYMLDADGNTLTVVSDGSGVYFTDALPYGYYTAEISKEGYVTQYVNVTASDDNDVAFEQDILLTPEAQGNEYRITLEWGENPRDEDAHIVGDTPDDFHVYYASKNAYHNGELVANLDHDDTQGNGFETVTLTVDPEGTYSYYVYHFAGTGSLATSNAIVKVYQGGVMIRQYNVPVEQGDGLYWNVFRIEDGKVVTVNRIADSALN